MPANIVMLQGETILSHTNTEGKKLMPGDKIRVKVLEIFGDRVILDMKGKLMSAKTKLDLQPQERISMTYQGFQNGQAVFKIEEGEQTQTNNNEIELEKYIKQELVKIGVKPTSENINYAKDILKAGLPLTKENINGYQEILKEIKDEGSLNESKRVGLFVLSQKSSIKTEHIKYAKELMKNMPDSIDKIMEKLELAQKELEKLVKEKPELELKQKNIKEKLDAFIKENKIEITSKNPQRIKNYLSNLKSLELMELINELDENTEKNLFQLKRNLASILKNMISQDFHDLKNNLLQKDETIFEIPLYVDDKWHKTGIKIKQKASNNKNKVQKNIINISFDIETNNLGKVIVDLNIHNKNISGDIKVKDEFVLKQIRDNLFELEEGIKSFDYNSKIKASIINADDQKEDKNKKDTLKGFKIKSFDIRI